MYLNHYGLKEKPFEMSPGPRFLWLGEKHLEALATLQYGISENKGFLLLTGDVGLGKTALIHRLIKEIDGSKVVAYVPNPGMESLDFFNILSIELGMDQKFASKGAFLIELKKFLYKNQSENKKVLLVIDEAQRLYHKLLEEIRLLSNIEMESQKLINIFFVGQTEFNHILLEPRNRALRQRIAIRYQVEPLNQQETSHYIVHRLKVAGATHKIFKFNAFHEIFRFSRGCPRLINIICDHALLTGYAAGLKTIDSNVIRECEPELKLPEEFELTPIQPPLSEDLNPIQIEPLPSIETPQIRNFRKLTHRSKFRNHPILIGFLGILIGFMSYYFLWPTDQRLTQPTTLQELTQPLDNKSEAILGKRPNSKETAEEALPQEPKETETSVTEAGDMQDTLDLKKPRPAPEVLANNRPTLTGQNTLTPNELIVTNKYKDDQPVLIEEENNSVKLTESTDDRLNPIYDKNQTSSNGSEVAESKKSTATATEKKGVENLDDQVKDAPLFSENNAVTGKQDLDLPEKFSDEKSSEKLASILPPNLVNLAEDKPTTKTEPDRIGTNPTPLPLKQEVAPDITQKKPDEVEERQPKQSVEKSVVVKLDPSSDNILRGDELRNRVLSFLQQYCNTYAAKELDNFTSLFRPDAKENGKPFASLLPKYQKNFGAIEKIQYRIDLQKYTHNEEEKTVQIEGRFFLKWMPYGQDWRENSGIILMSLNESGNSFMVQSLEYYGDRAQNTSGSESRSP